MKSIKDIINCQKCSLYKDATNKVPGTGDYNADIMAICEAPGKNEDKYGYPLVGRPGVMFNKILNYLKLNRNELFVTNILKCRPPNNRNPKDSEVKKCSTHLIKQVKKVRPKIILPFGKFSTAFILSKSTNNITMKSAMEKIYTIQNNIKVVPMYHPSYLLRNGSRLKPVKPQLNKIKNIIKGK